jgi:hypothetical protein
MYMNLTKMVSDSILDDVVVFPILMQVQKKKAVDVRLNTVDSDLSTNGVVVLLREKKR